MTSRSTLQLSPTEMAAELNPVLRGWAGYFCLGPVSDTYQTINSHVRYRFRKWWQAKHKSAKPDWGLYQSPWLQRQFGLLQLKWEASRLPNAKA
jgi:hypothetical protein